MRIPIEWSTFCLESKARYSPSNALDLVKLEWEEVSRQKGERMIELNDHFGRLFSKLDLPQPMLNEMWADTYTMYKIDKGNQEVYKDLVRYNGTHDMTHTFEQRMEHVTMLEMCINKSLPGCGSSAHTNTTMRVSARKMDLKICGTTGTAGTAKDNGLSYYNCGQVGHISGHCPNRDLMKKLQEQALVHEDAPKSTLDAHTCTRKREAHHPVE